MTHNSKKPDIIIDLDQDYQAYTIPNPYPNKAEQYVQSMLRGIADIGVKLNQVVSILQIYLLAQSVLSVVCIIIILYLVMGA